MISRKTFFAGILNELKEANTLINTNDKIGGDIVYNGNIERWKKLINSYRLKNPYYTV